MATQDDATLPLHPRARQHAFAELLAWRSDLTPAIADTVLPKRLQRLQVNANAQRRPGQPTDALPSQELYLSAVYAAKRGSGGFRASSSSDVTLRLTKDGSQLQVLAAEGDAVLESLALLEIQRIVVSSAQAFGFSLRLRGVSSSNQSDTTAEERNVSFGTPSAAALTQWVLLLTCGVNAFQQQQQPQEGGDALVWQAARLRIFELAAVLPLHEAVRSVTNCVQRLLRAAGAVGSTRGEDTSEHTAPLFLACT